MEGTVSRFDFIKRRLKLRSLEVFASVCEHGSMAKAADRLSVSQPAVSKTITELETIVGVKLLDRHAQGVELTSYGRLLLRWTAAVFDDIEQGVREIEFQADGSTGHLRIGATESIVAGILPIVLEKLSRELKNISFDIVQAGSAAHQLQLLHNREVDVVVGRMLRHNQLAMLKTEPLFDEPLFVVANRENPLTRRKRITLSDLKNESWCIPHWDTTVGEFIRNAFEASGIEPPKSGIRTNSYHVHLQMISSGRFLSMVPASVLKFSPFSAQFHVLPIELPTGPAPIVVTTVENRTISPVASLFLKAAREVSSGLGRKKRRQPVKRM